MFIFYRNFRFVQSNQLVRRTNELSLRPPLESFHSTFCSGNVVEPLLVPAELVAPQSETLLSPHPSSSAAVDLYAINKKSVE